MLVRLISLSFRRQGGIHYSSQFTNGTSSASLSGLCCIGNVGQMVEINY